MPKPVISKNRIIRYDRSPLANASIPICYHFDTVYGKQGIGSYTNWHKELEILYFTEGTADVMCNGQAYSVQAGDMAILFPYSLHYVMNTTNECKLYCLLIDPTYIADPPFWKDRNTIFTSGNRSHTDAVKRILQELQEPTAYSFYIIKGELISLVGRMEHQADPEAQNTQMQSSRYLSICSVVRYIQQNCTRQITLKEICDVAHMSRSYFSQCFLQATGLSFIDYINHARCERAYTMLGSNTMSIGECASACGFQSLSYFSRKFRQIYGFSPSQLVSHTAKTE